SVVSSLDADIILEGEILDEENLAFAAIPSAKLPKGSEPRFKKVTPLAIEVRRQVMEVNKDLLSINPGWLGVGTRKRDVPRDACYVACHKGCDGTYYAWVCKAGVPAFEQFTLKVLSFSSLLKESQVLGISGP